ncbi:hypothetical protein BC938DRAFT_479678 [Jimgerdemannia flammicorona]|uniref:Uncharacterized protein n=1 Tax=Jimgerdemannia flammicorona TaxID=994334 RepID=A0A433QKF8_9FUNG|nr:hypothetical protein BC938DRAFT_479678 [Jimgerdemannia flammicorona]
MPIFKKMEQRRYGQIAIVSSTSSLYGMANMIWFNQSKSALTAFARDLQYIGEERNIWVSGMLRMTPTGLSRILSSSAKFIALQSSLPLMMHADSRRAAKYIKVRLWS